MSILLRNLSLKPGTDEALIPYNIASRFGLDINSISSFNIVRKGVDARRKGKILYVYTVQFDVPDQIDFVRKNINDKDIEILPEFLPEIFERKCCNYRILIVGTGPAGIFSALRLSEYGINSTIIDRGKKVSERINDVKEFWEKGVLNTESNVQFGEGGAGTFSDGKLTTRIRDRNIAYVLNKLVEFGAPKEIATLAKPHVGTDKLRKIIVSIRKYLEKKGTSFLFGHKLTDISSRSGKLTHALINGSIEIPCDYLILAPGNSSRDTFEMLEKRGVLIESKSFAIGLRVEHPQELINEIQYGVPYDASLPVADYSLTYNDLVSGRSLYSFCMCPGGLVVAGSSELEGVVTNGMSNFLRNSPYANSALVVTVGKDDFVSGSPLGGVYFQREMESAAFRIAGGDYSAPAQSLISFIGGKPSGKIRSSYSPGVKEADLSELFPDVITRTLRDGIHHFNKKMRGFITSEATLTGVESRTSSPVRIIRGESLQSPSMEGLYPVGEGAGYAGGIMSAALDGIRVADAIVSSLSP